MEYKYQDIEYGKFRNDKWETLNGLASVQRTLDRIKEELDWTGFSLYVHGSILLDVDTHDIDLTIQGSMLPPRINQLLEGCVRIGFEEKQLVDVKYSLSYDLYDPEIDGTKTILYACYQPKITVDGTTFDYGKLVYDLYLKETTYPMTKTKDSGLVYKSPQKLI